MKKLLTLVLALGLVLSMVASASAVSIAFSQSDCISLKGRLCYHVYCKRQVMP